MGLMISKEPVIETDRLILRPITLDEQAKELEVVIEIVNYRRSMNECIVY